jgi:hypothetical protein
MSALTGTYINQTYGGVVHLSTNAAIAAGVSTTLEDGAGNNLGISLNTNGTVTATTFVGNLTGTASTASYSTTLGANLSSPANNQVRLLNSANGTLATVTVNNVTSASFADNANTSISSSFSAFSRSGSYALSSSFATQASTAFNANATTSASYAANADLLDGLNSTQLATTASNVFRGNQTITGSVSILGSIINITGSTTFTGSINQNVFAIPTVNEYNPLYNTCSIDFNSGSYFTYTLATYGSPSTHFVVRNLKPGSSATIEVSQDVTGFGTATFASNITFPSGSKYVPFNSASAADVITLISYDGVKVRAVAANNFI